jgi:hypothetical protein
MSRGRTAPPPPLPEADFIDPFFAKKGFFRENCVFKFGHRTVNCNHKIFDKNVPNAMVAHPGVMQAYPGNGGECWSLRCSHWSREGTPWSVILSQWSHGGSPWRMKSSHWSPGGSIWSIRCSHWKEL